MQVNSGSYLSQLISGAAGARPDAAATRSGTPKAPSRPGAPAAQPQQAGAVTPTGAGPDAAKPRTLPRGSLVNIVT